MTDWTLNFPSESAAEKALADAGFSLGTNQRDDPRGIMFGDVDISKWRQLSEKDKDALHGVYRRTGGRGSPVRITLRSGGAPGDAIRQLEDAAE